MTDPRIKVLKIKTGVVKRLTKEKICYEKEADQQKERIQKYKDEGKDDADINKQNEVLQESLAMIIDCQRRLSKAFQELETILKDEEDLKETEEYIAAIQILEDAKPVLNSYRY
uniref:Tubulin-specific chaperone A n=1 Tax=Riptortus pedestris TaxID=329032 RepID=R4WD42_RIPPE|nr:cofactor A, putative [Riptortus pedestris]